MMLAVWLLVLGVGVHSSPQDLVTIAPSEPEVVTMETERTPETTSEISEKSAVTPTIRALNIVSTVRYRYATTLVSSRVVNPAAQAGQASFTVTLPESAFISEFLMEVKGKVYKAYVKEKEEAKAVYDQAVQAGQFAGHVALDARDSNQFTVSVNIEAHGKVTFNLTYEQLLTRNLGLYSNVININPQQIVDDMSVIVDIEEPTEITKLEVPELQISNEAVPDESKQNALAKIEDKSTNHKQVVWAPTPEQQKSQRSTGLSGQFIVKYDVNREENPQQILVDEGYFVHFFAPESLPRLRKHVVFVLDYSGSMMGRKLEQLKDAMNRILSDLDSKDYFSIAIFHSYVEAWSPKKKYNTALQHMSEWEMEKIEGSNTTLDREFVVEATPANIDLARSYLTNYSDLGATNIMGGLRTGLELVNIGSELWINESEPPQPVVVFLTDGQPNMEEYNTDAIINKTNPLNTKQSPIFSLAFGYGADFNFLRKLSLSNYGFARNIYEAADASDQLKNFYQAVASPLLANVTFTYLPGQVDNSSNTKRVFPVYFKGSEIVVAGKINKDTVKDKETIGELSGVTAMGFKRYPIIVDVIRKPENRTLGHLEKTWAYLTIQQLLDKADSLDKSDEKNQTKDKALKLALQYSFVTPLTSLVVVKPNETEKAVDTTQVKPGLDNSGPTYASAGFPSASYASSVPLGLGGGYGAGGFAVPAPLPPNLMLSPSSSHLPSFLSTTVSTSEDHRSSMVPVDRTDNIVAEDATESAVQKISLSKVKWLQQFLSNSSASDNVTVTVEGQQYTLGTNVTDESFGSCQVKSETGECHHFQFCVLDVFQEDVTEFLPYKCPIAGDYLGVCCPKTVS